METYGPEQVRALTRASRRFLENPPAGFVEHPLLSRRGTLVVATKAQEQQLEEYWEEISSSTTLTRRLTPFETLDLAPVIREGEVFGAVYEPHACDIDVHALHQGYLRELRRRGGIVHCAREVTGLERNNGNWRVSAGDTVFAAPVVIYAAGAWADVIAKLAGVTPIGLEPQQRSAFI